MRTELRRRLAVDDRFVLLTTAYLIKAKGIDTAVRAWPPFPNPWCYGWLAMARSPQRFRR